MSKNAEPALDRMAGSFIGFIKEKSGCRNVGLRLGNDRGDYPFFKYLGYSPGFIKKEMSLKNGQGSSPGALACYCGGVIGQNRNGLKKFLTKYGSLIINTIDREQIGKLQDKVHNARNTCIDTGHESLALIPVRNNGECLGLFHICDKKKYRFKHRDIEVLEYLAELFGKLYGALK